MLATIYGGGSSAEPGNERTAEDSDDQQQSALTEGCCAPHLHTDIRMKHCVLMVMPNPWPPRCSSTGRKAAAAKRSQLHLHVGFQFESLGLWGFQVWGLGLRVSWAELRMSDTSRTFEILERCRLEAYCRKSVTQRAWYSAQSNKYKHFSIISC